MLSDICINSGAEISFEKLNFHIYGSDDAVKAAMMVINNIPFREEVTVQHERQDRAGQRAQGVCQR